MQTKFDIDEVVAVKGVVEDINVKKNGRIIYKIKLLGNDSLVFLEEENVHKYQFDREDNYNDEC